MGSSIPIKHKYVYLILLIFCIQLDGLEYCFLTVAILFKKHSDRIWLIFTQLYGLKMTERFYLAHRWDPNRDYLGVMDINGYYTFPLALGASPSYALSVISMIQVQEVGYLTLLQTWNRRVPQQIANKAALLC